jgi:ligand-binding sensor protein
MEGFLMARKSTYEELERRVNELEKAEAERKKFEEDLRQSEKELMQIKGILEDRVEAVLSPENSLADLETTDLLRIETLKELNEAIADAFDVCLLLTDANGNYITGPTNLCEFCQVVRRTEKGLERCKVSDAVLAKKAPMSAHPIITRCSNIGFINAAVPIHIRKRHMASWLVGQFCPPEVDEKRVRQCALEIGLDEQELLAAYDKMKIRPVEEMENALELLAVIVRHLSEYGLNNLTLAREITSRKRAEEALRQSERELSIRSRIAEIFLKIPDDQMYYEVLQIILEVLESPYGTFAYINENGDRVVPVLTKDIWADCEVQDADILFPRE